MPSRRLTKKTIKGKDGVHPGSRKAGQLQRVDLRTAKLKHQARNRKDLATAKLFRPLFFLHALSSTAPLSLSSLRYLVSDVFLTRNNEQIAQLTKERREGRPKSKELLELEELKRREDAEWETGFEVLDLTHGPTTRLLFFWQEAETNLTASHLALLRHIRVFRDQPDVVVVSREGKEGNMGLGEGLEGEVEEWAAAQPQSQSQSQPEGKSMEVDA